MLVVSAIQENKEKVLEGLKKRNFKQLELVEEVLPGDAVKVTIEEVEDGTRSVRLESID